MLASSSVCLVELFASFYVCYFFLFLFCFYGRGGDTTGVIFGSVSKCFSSASLRVPCGFSSITGRQRLLGPLSC